MAKAGDYRLVLSQTFVNQRKVWKKKRTITRSVIGIIGFLSSIVSPYNARKAIPRHCSRTAFLRKSTFNANDHENISHHVSSSLLFAPGRTIVPRYAFITQVSPLKETVQVPGSQIVCSPLAQKQRRQMEVMRRILQHNCNLLLPKGVRTLTHQGNPKTTHETDLTSNSVELLKLK